MKKNVVKHPQMRVVVYVISFKNLAVFLVYPQWVLNVNLFKLASVEMALITLAIAGIQIRNLFR